MEFDIFAESAERGGLGAYQRYNVVLHVIVIVPFNTPFNTMAQRTCRHTKSLLLRHLLSLVTTATAIMCCLWVVHNQCAGAV